ncbi:hypothetical protein LCGC14_2764390 [marine sediment metagenome]|uniref:Uncharacterized protein n=1 Tax=marine sediment metagenome TaxID=412755 RepID=A0A0F9BPK5_9ZZZZ
MKIRTDYIGNVYKDKKIHGLKRNTDKYGNFQSLAFCGCNYNWTDYRPPCPNPAENDRALLAGAITCKRCRSILNLSLERAEEPDYYLISDTTKGIPEDMPIPIAVCKSEEEVKDILKREAILHTANHVRIYYKIVGVKEVVKFSSEIISKGYEIKLHKQ